MTLHQIHRCFITRASWALADLRAGDREGARMWAKSARDWWALYQQASASAS